MRLLFLSSGPNTPSNDAFGTGGDGGTCPPCLAVLRDGEPAREGLAGLDGGNNDPCSPFAVFRARVYVLATAWRIQTHDHLLGPAN